MKLNIQLFAHTNATTNYELPQFVGTDKPTWLGDFNEAMADIDAGMHENASDIASMESDVAAASAAASQASQDVTTLTGTVNTLSSTVSSVQTTANNASQTASSALNTANTANGKADTNASAITTLQGNVTDLEPVSLYDNVNGTNGTVTLSDSVANYEYIEILFREEETGTTVYKSLKVHNPNGKSVILDMVDFHDSKLIFNTKVVAISGTSITNIRYKRYTIADSASWSPFGSNDNTIYINTVLGYK